MCSNPLEISYSHIAQITLQDAPNVISQGFSSSICCQGETVTSNKIYFRHFLFLPTSFLLFIPLIPRVRSYSGSNPLLGAIVVGVSSTLGGCNEFSQTVWVKRPLTGTGGLWWTCCTHKPWRNARQFSVVTLYCKSVSNPPLRSLHHSTENRRADGAMGK